MTKANFQREAIMFKALSNPKRLEIVHLLSHRELTATDIQKMTGFPQANLSQHLRELKDGRVVVAVRRGKHITYRLSDPRFSVLTAVLQDIHSPKAPKQQETKKSEVQDLVCGMWVEPASARWQSLYKGATYFFCAAGCRRQFLHSPQSYL